MAESTRLFKNGVYEQLGRIGKAASAPKRLELLDLLCQGPRTVELLAEQTAISVANASRHLQVLRAARLVDGRKQGLYVEYRLADDEVGRFFVMLRELATSRLAEVELMTRAFMARRGALEAVHGDELLRRVKTGEVTILDVRPAEEYRAGHIPGALSVPVADLRARLQDIPRDRDVVAYCRGPYCVMAVDAVALLRRMGFTAHRLEQGVADWRARGWRVATGPERPDRPPRARAAR
jgi:rhodanese-related sulfurtransferase/DNA-binding transcriptional ArsR family regulator